MVNPGNSSDAPLLRLLPANAHALGLELLVIEAREASELPVAFDHVTRDRAQALFISSGPLFFSHRKEIVAMAARERLPAIYGWREFPEAGGLVSYGAGLVPAARHDGRQDSQWRKPSRSAGRGSSPIRIGGQPQDDQGIWA
jgi:putative ABC transport system substrate-binding protein